MEIFVSYLYTEDYVYEEAKLPTKPEASTEAEVAQITEQDCPELIVHAKVYIVADKYGIPTLKGLALERFKAALSTIKMDSFAALFQYVW